MNKNNYWSKFKIFYSEGWKDFKENIKLIWPFFGVITTVWIISGLLLWNLEKCKVNSTIKGLGDALYCVWITMATVGYGDFRPITPKGKIIVSIDAFFGLVFVGLMVWLITSSFTRS